MDEPPLDVAPRDWDATFRNQRVWVIPRPQVDRLLTSAGTRHLTITDAGHFPRACGHEKSRPRGSREAIVILCVDGKGTVEIAGDVHAVSAGQYAILPSHVPHRYAADPEDPWSIWWLHAGGTDVDELISPLFGPTHPVRQLQSVDRVTALFDELVVSLERHFTPAHLLAASGIGWYLLVRLATDSVLPAQGSPVERAMRYLEARVDGSIHVGELAKLVGISPSHLSAQFKLATGGGPAAFHISLKMARARELLDTTSLAIADVADAVGYADPLYFSRQFRRIHGVNPSGYRAQHKG